MDNFIGQDLGRYRIIEQLGEGGMATIYKAFDTRLETEVAIKLIRLDKLSSGIANQAVKRFEREARALAHLTHPNIVSIIDYGAYEGRPYLVMPFLPGGTLKALLKEKKKFNWQDAVEMLLPIASALEYAHSLHIIHRDVKPSNILITQTGLPMLSDFGVAKLTHSEYLGELTTTGIGIGTPEYMAPEQFHGHSDESSDIYALGVVLFEMITGQKPYQADTPAAIIIKQATEPLPRPGKLVSSLPQQVENVLYKALARDPKARYQHMQGFTQALRQLSRQINSSPHRKMGFLRWVIPLGVSLITLMVFAISIVYPKLSYMSILDSQEDLSLTSTQGYYPASIPFVIPNLLRDATIMYSDDFNSIDLNWDLDSIAKISGGILKLTGNLEGYYNAARFDVVHENQGVLLLFRCQEGGDQGIELQSGDWNTMGMKRWGIKCNDTSAFLLSNVFYDEEIPLYVPWEGNLIFSYNIWYALMFTVEGSTFTARIWDPADINQYLEMQEKFDSSWFNRSWDFIIEAYNGIIELDYYQEFQLP